MQNRNVYNWKCVTNNRKSFEKQIEIVGKYIKTDNYKQNINSMNKSINAAGVDLKTISETNKILKNKRDDIEGEIKNAIDNYKYSSILLPVGILLKNLHRN